MSVYAPMVGMFWRTLEIHGVDPRGLIDADVYRPDAPSLSDMRVSAERYFRLQERVFGLLRHPDIGLRMARQIHPSFLGPLGYAWLASSSLRTAIYRARRYWRMFNERAGIEITEGNGELRASYHVFTNHAFPFELADMQYGSLLMICRWNAGQNFCPARLQLRRPEPANPSRWNEFFGVTVEFGCEGDLFVIDQSSARRKLTGSNPMLVSAHEDLIRRLLQSLHQSELERHVQSIIIDQLPSGMISETSVAETLGLSRRSLHRRLQREGTSFRPLLEEVRRKLAKEYLADPEYSVTDISFLLGFAETSAFSRAFRRWFGCAPSHYRSRQASR